MNLKIMLAVTASFMLVSCDNAQVSTRLDTSKLTYAQDIRTGMCFATIGRAESAIGMRAASLSFTHVPCTAEVMAQIRRGG